MANLTRELVVVKSQLSRLLPRERIHEVCRALNHRWRKRVLEPDTTVYMLLLQLLTGVALAGMKRVTDVAVSAASICAARMRLPLSVWRMLLVASTDFGCGGGEGAYHGRRVFVADGTAFTTPDTPELARKYNKASNQHTGGGGKKKKGKKVKGLGYPMVRLLGLMNLATGAITKVVQIPAGRGEQSMLWALLGALGFGDLLLGDAGLVGYAQFALLQFLRIEFLMRLPRNKVVFGRGRGKRVRGRRGKRGKKPRHAKPSRGDIPVRWLKPDKPKWVPKTLWKNLPARLELRQIAVQLYRRGHRPKWAWAITSLTNPATDTAAELVELYGKRYRIETAFRHLKVTTGMNHLSAKTVAGVEKEILAFVILYNLVRRVMAEAAAKQAIKAEQPCLELAERISFTDAFLVLLYHPPHKPIPEIRINPTRIRPGQPRARKHGGYRFPQLKVPREQLETPPAEVRVGGIK